MESGSEHVGKFGYPVAGLSAYDQEQWPELRITVQPRGERVIQVIGDVDMLTAPALDKAIMDNLVAQPPVLVLDLSEVTFLASTGLATLMSAQEGCRAAGTALRLVGAQQRVLRPMELTGLIGLFEVHPDLESALAGQVSQTQG